MDALITAVAGLATSLVVGGIRAGTSLLEKLPPVGRSIVVLVVAEGVAVLNRLSGLGLGDDPATWTATAVHGLLVWLAAMGLHAVKKAVVK